MSSAIRAVPRVYCATCKESSIDVGDKRCAWCGDPFSAAIGDSRSFLSPAQIEQAHREYCDGATLQELAEELLPTTQYASVATCCAGIRNAFTRAGYERRRPGPRSEIRTPNSVRRRGRGEGS